MAHERTQKPWNQPSTIPAGFDWPSLMAQDGDALENHYRHTLETLGTEPGMLGIIFRKAQNKIQDPAKLRRLIVDLIDREQWTMMSADVKGDAYEGLLEQCDVHTLLRLPTGIFYAQGVKANVIFFDRKPGSEHPWTRKLWIYDLRTNKHFTLKTNPLARADLDEFVACYNPANPHERTPTWSEENPDGRWRCYDNEDLIARDKVNLDIFWLRDESLEDSANLPAPDVLAQEIIEDLRAALEEFELIREDLAEEPALVIGDGD
jgi:type I restriction-modification system DNA methylase subunit